jgi:hypothetical protein
VVEVEVDLRKEEVELDDNVVVNTIVRMFTRKAVGKVMKLAKKSTGAGKGNE